MPDDKEGSYKRSQTIPPGQRQAGTERPTTIAHRGIEGRGRRYAEVGALGGSDMGNGTRTGRGDSGRPTPADPRTSLVMPTYKPAGKGRAFTARSQQFF